MTYIKAYKLIYIALLAINFPLLLAEETDSLGRSAQNFTLGLVMLSINIFTLVLILQNKLGKVGFVIEKTIFLFRLGGIFLGGSIFGLFFLYFSPVSASLWIPLFSFVGSEGKISNLIVWYFILVALLSAELINYKLLKSNKALLMRNITSA